MSATTTAAATDTIGALTVDLLRQVFGGRTASIELSPQGVAAEVPTGLPAIRVRVSEARLDPIRGQVHGEVFVVAYTDESNRLDIDLQRLTSRGGTVHDRYAVHPSGDLRRITRSTEPTVSTLDDGATATAHRWTISNAVPAVPTLRHNDPTEQHLSTLATGFALAVSRPTGRARPLVTAQAISQTAWPVWSDEPGVVEHVAEVRLLLRPTRRGGSNADAARSAVGNSIDLMEGRAIDGLGRLSRAALCDLTAVPSGLRASVRVLIRSREST